MAHMPERRFQLVGRERERGAIEELLRSVEHGESAAVLELAGEPGIGKTSLLDVLSESRRTGRLVLRGRAAEFERDLPYGLFIDALDPHLEVLGKRRCDRLDGEGVAELAGVFPSLRRQAAAPGVVVQDERFRLHRAVRALLEQLAGRGSLVLALDDVHFADPASCELLASLLRRLPDAPVLLSLTYRSGRAPPAVAGELIAAARAGRVTRIELGPLGRADADVLMAGIGSASRHRVYAQSGGNPFYLQQLVRSAQSGRNASAGLGPAAEAGEALAGAVPAEVAAAITQELASLPPKAQAVVQAAAVTGDPFEPDLVADIAGVAEADALLALDELQDRDLIRATAVAREFQFRHPLVRAAVYASLKSGWRMRAHARAADGLAQRGATAVICAPHVEQSARRGDQAAIALLVEAGRTALGRAPASAAHWLSAALRLVPARGPGSERRLALMPELADALVSIGAIEPCRDALVQALEVMPEASDERRIRLIAGCARTEIFLRRYEDARARLTEALATVGHEPTPAGVQLELEVAAYGTYVNDLELAVRSARSALARSRQLRHPGLQASAAAILSLSSYAAGRIAEAEDAHDDASALVAGLADGAIARHAELLWFLGWAGWFLGRYHEAETHFGRGIAVSRTSGDSRLLIELMVGHAITLTWLGRLTEAVTLSEEALEAAQLNDNPNRLMWCSIARCLSLTATGELDTALIAGEQAVAIGRELGRSVVAAAAGWTYAAALIEAGEHGRGAQLLLEMLGGPELPNYFAGMRPLCYGLLTRAEAGRARGPAAREWALRADASAKEVGSTVARACADLALAEARLDDNVVAAAELALRAAEAFERTAARLDAARAQLVAGRALSAAGDRERAGEELRRAEQAFAGFGAQRLRAETVRELRRIGRRVRAASRRGATDGDRLASLSGREREVAELVTARKTNREIAAELFLSEKTVESHLSRVFVKLGVNSRVDVARAVERARAPAGG